MVVLHHMAVYTLRGKGSDYTGQKEATMRTAVCVALALLTFESFARAEIVEFQIDPQQTHWSMRGAYFRDGQPQADLEPQFPGSEVTSLTGILRVNLTDTTIQFLPGSVLDAVLQPLPQQPGPNGAAGAAPADFGMAAPSLPLPIPVFAAREFSLGLNSPVIPLVAGQFRQDIQAVVNATIDYNLGTSAGASKLINWSRGFDDDNAGSLTTNGLAQTIQLQNYLGDIFALQTPGDSFFEWSGPIVATRLIPEPANFWPALFVSIAAFGFIAHKRGVPLVALNSPQRALQ